MAAINQPHANPTAGRTAGRSACGFANCCLLSLCTAQKAPAVGLLLRFSCCPVTQYVCMEGHAGLQHEPMLLVQVTNRQQGRVNGQFFFLSHLLVPVRCNKISYRDCIQSTCLKFPTQLVKAIIDLCAVSPRNPAKLEIQIKQPMKVIVQAVPTK